MPYPGGKSLAGTYQTIINQIPPHRKYIEPFLGSGAIMRLKRPAAQNVGIDRLATIDGVGDRSRATFESQNEAFPAGFGDARGFRCEGNRIKDFDDFFRPTFEFKKGCGLNYLEKSEISPGTFIYCDPPYLMSTRSGKRIYEHEMTEADHIRLLNAITGLSCMVMISGYMSDMYADRLQGWRLIQFDAITRGGTMRTECLWMNYPEPVELHDYRYLGKDFRERERIRKKRNRWVKNLRRMPTLERNALIQELNNCE